jgi:hypothetical protein
VDLCILVASTLFHLEIEYFSIELTIDGAIHVVNLENGIVLALSKCGNVSAMVHRNGKIFSYRSRVEIQAFHSRGNRYGVGSKWIFLNLLRRDIFLCR